MAITTAARRKDRRSAFRWLFSPYYRDQMYTLKWVKRLLFTLFPSKRF
jgi:hypothetical protein